MTSIRVALADDHTLFRRGLRLLLESQSDMRVVGEAADGAACLEMVERERPAVLLMDVTMPGLDGIQATAAICRRWPEVRVVGLTMHGNSRYFRALMDAGAVGYLLKGANPDDLLAAVRLAARGESYLDPVMARILVAEYRLGRRPRAGPGDLLSPREEQILGLIAEGKTGREIAADLGISPFTVERHRSNILAKLKARNKAELIQVAIRRGLIEPDGPPEPGA